MPWLYGDEDRIARRRYLTVRGKRAFYDCLSLRRIGNPCFQFKKNTGWSRCFEGDLVLGCDGARGRLRVVSIHQMPCRCPIAMAIEQRANDSAIDHAFKRKLVVSRRELCINIVTLYEALDLQAQFVGRSATEAL